MEWAMTVLAVVYGAGCVYLNGQRLKWREEAHRLQSEVE